MSLGYHRVTWDVAKIARFWDYMAQSPTVKEEYFSWQVGAGVVQFLEQHVPAGSRVMDFGCGPGHLIAHLTDAGYVCAGADFSSESTEQINARMRGHRQWLGARAIEDMRLDWPDASFDAVTCLETIEHTLDEHLVPMMFELQRVLRPGGCLLLTTPHDEELERSKVCCPDCGAVFHRYQHVRSFTTSTIRTLGEQRGMKTIACSATDFSRWQLKGRRLVQRQLGEWYVRLRGGAVKQPHLYWLGVKESAACAA